MKFIIKKLLSIFSKVYLKLSQAGIRTKGNTFCFFKIKLDKKSKFLLSNSDIQKTTISVIGDENFLKFNESLLVETSISIDGNNNKIILAEGVKLRKANIIIRGNNCTLTIGRNTSFGGIRIINVGSDCDITIGENCLFADHIELWASDTHPIYDEQNQVINPEESVTIKDDVWVGSHVTILKGVTVHSGSVIGIGAMVTKDIPAKVISVGSPNRTIKENISWSLDYKD